MCTFCKYGIVESEKYFILVFDAFKETRENYENILASIFWHYLFSERIVRKLGHFIINLNNKKIEL